MLSDSRVSSLSFEYRRIDCPTCEADRTEVIGRRGGSAHRSGAGELCTIVRCRGCSLLYPNPFPFPTDLDALYSDTEDYFCFHPDQQTKTDGREELIAKIEQLTPGRRLLDVGAGLGETVAAAIRRGWDSYGVETSSRFVEKASRIAPGRILHCALENAPASLRDEPFDAVVLAAVLEHLHEPSKMLGLIATYLKPGGVVFLDVPNESGLFFRLGNLWHRLHGRDWVVNLAPTFSPYHVFGFNRASLTAILNKNGFSLEEFRVFAGTSCMPFQRSVRGAVEWLGSNAAHLAARGEHGTYISCFARKR
jgi:2-polyprenyl-3-methyl-5-hydroxy-6-metoxy-1,4-benzoquinol methylase